MLYQVAHSITYLIYPLYWQGVFIPVLPARLMACLQAPVPYIMGIERQYKGIDLLPEDVRNNTKRNFVNAFLLEFLIYLFFFIIGLYN